MYFAFTFCFSLVLLMYLRFYILHVLIVYVRCCAYDVFRLRNWRGSRKVRVKSDSQVVYVV